MGPELVCIINVGDNRFVHPRSLDEALHRQLMERSQSAGAWLQMPGVCIEQIYNSQSAPVHAEMLARSGCAACDECTLPRDVHTGLVSSYFMYVLMSAHAAQR